MNAIRRPVGMIKVNNDIIIKNAPVDKKFWDVYLKCCANQASLSDVETVRIVRRSTFGYHLYFDPIDMTATVISFKIRIIKEKYEDSKAETHEAIQQLVGG